MKKYDLNKFISKQCQHLSTGKHNILLNILNRLEDLFESTLGTWNITTVDLDLKDDPKPVCSQPYPLPRVHKVMFKKEFEILVILGVL